MSNDCYSLNDNEKKDKLKMYKLIKPEIDVYLLQNRLTNVKRHIIEQEHNTNNTDRTTNITNFLNLNNKNENLSFNNISNSNLSQLNRNNEKISLNKNILQKLKKLNLPNFEKYSNAILFHNRKTKHLKFITRNKSELNKNKYKYDSNKNSTRKYIIKSCDLKSKFLTPAKRIINSNRNDTYNSNNKTCAQHNINRNNSSTIKLQRVNSAFLLPKIKTLNLEYNSSFSSSNKENEKEKIIINQNLNKLFYKIKKKIMPKKRVILSTYKLPSIINKKDKINSCIHKLEYGNSIVFVKTHLDGLEEKKKRKERQKAKTIRKYEINEGYVDLNVLNCGDNISFKTNLIAKDGIYYYEFNKNGRMETVEEKVHRVKKDKKEFQNLLERYKKNKMFKCIENKDFEINIKRNYGAEPIINKYIYRDLFHMLFKK